MFTHHPVFLRDLLSFAIQFQYSCQFNSFSFIYIAPVTIKIVSRHAMLCHIMHHLTSLFSHFSGIIWAGGSAKDHEQTQRIFIVFMLFFCSLASCVDPHLFILLYVCSNTKDYLSHITYTVTSLIYMVHIDCFFF